MKTCSMCGKETKDLFMCWYRYDNGEQFRSPVCRDCKELHDRMV